MTVRNLAWAVFGMIVMSMTAILFMAIIYYIATEWSRFFFIMGIGVVLIVVRRLISNMN